MALSSLSAQLAALSSAGGSSLPTSKRKDDAIGRGLHHSSKLGYAPGAASDPRYAPSILHPDSRAASDVPLTTLQSNAVASLRRLYQLTDNRSFVEDDVISTLCGPRSVSFERGTATSAENAKIDEIIERLLLLLSTTLGNEGTLTGIGGGGGTGGNEEEGGGGTSARASSLHVLEYLLRRYTIHARPTTSSALLLCTLPHHDDANIFARVLHIVDLASLPSWSFLRPYAARGAGTPPRTFLAKRASKDDSLVGLVCRLAQDASGVGAAEHHSSTSVGMGADFALDDGLAGATTGPTVVVRRGISRILSFCAALLVEAIEMQSISTATSGNNTGVVGVNESTIRVLLPCVIAACSGRLSLSSSAAGNEAEEEEGEEGGAEGSRACPADWVALGYILTSTLVERAALSDDVREVLANAIVSGGFQRPPHRQPSKSRSDNEDDDDIEPEEMEEDEMSSSALGAAAWSMEELERASDAILTLMTVLTRGRRESSKSGGKDDDDEDHGSSYLQSSVQRGGGSSSSLGCYLPPSTYQSLCGVGSGGGRRSSPRSDSDRAKLVAASLGHVSSERDVDVSDLVAALAARALGRLDKECRRVDRRRRKQKKKKGKKNKMTKADEIPPSGRLLVALIREPSLQSAWGDRRVGLTATVSLRVVMAFAKGSDGEDDEEEGERHDDTLLVQSRSILDALRFVDPAGCDNGVASAVTSVASDVSSGKKAAKKKSKTSVRAKFCARRVALLLRREDKGGGAGSGAKGRSERVGGAAGSTPDRIDGDVLPDLLPARVALEHPDAAVRLAAVARAVEEDAAQARLTGRKRGEQMEQGAEMSGSDGLAMVLLRRLSSDDDVAVAAAAGLALLRLVEDAATAASSVDSLDFLSDPSFSDGALSSVAKWSPLNQPKSHKKKKKQKHGEGRKGEAESEGAEGGTGSSAAAFSKDRLVALRVGLLLCGYAARVLAEDVSFDDGANDAEEQSTLCFLIPAIVFHLDVKSTFEVDEKSSVSIGRAAASALGRAVLTGNDECGEMDTSSATKLLTSNETCIGVLRACIAGDLPPPSSSSGDDPLSTVVRRKYLLRSLLSYEGAFKSQKSDVARMGMSTDILSLAFNLLESYDASDTATEGIREEASILIQSFGACFGSLSMVNDIGKISHVILRLSSIGTQSAFENISLHAIRAIVDRVASVSKKLQPAQIRTSPVLLLFDACSQKNATKDAIIRLIQLAREFSTKDVNGTNLSVTPALALLAHADRKVREVAMNFISSIPAASKVDDKESAGEEKLSLLSEICALVSDDSPSMRSAISMDGAGSLHQLLRQAVQTSQTPDAMKEYLLFNCQLVAMCFDEKASSGLTDGGCHVATVLLLAMESAGETSFALIDRWKYAGNGLFSVFLGLDEFIMKQKKDTGSPFRTAGTSRSAKVLLDLVVQMLKGAVIDKDGSDSNAPNVVITTGPSTTGRRSRSYSVGNSDDLSFLDPYPQEMVAAILSAISVSPKVRGLYSDTLRRAVIRPVIGRSSWADEVFPKLSAKPRRSIASSLLKIRSQRDGEFAGSAFLGLPLGSDDCIWLLNQPTTSICNAVGLLAFTFLADYIKGRAEFLMADSSGSELATLLFDRLASLSGFGGDSQYGVSEEVEQGGSDYARSSILLALLALYKTSGHQATLTPKATKKLSRRRRSASDASRDSQVGDSNSFDSQATLLVCLVGGAANTGDQSSTKPLASGKAKALALSLLTHLCVQAPSVVVSKLLPAMMHVVPLSPKARAASVQRAQTRAAGEALMAMVPAYCTHAKAADLSLFQLLELFVGNCGTGENFGDTELEFYKYLVDALRAVSNQNDTGRALASLAACFLGVESFHSCVSKRAGSDAEEDAGPANGEAEEDIEMADYENERRQFDSVEFALSFLQHAPVSDQLLSLLYLLRYCGELLTGIGGISHFADSKSLLSPMDQKTPDFVDMKVSVSDIVALALEGPATRGGKKVHKTTYAALSDMQKSSLLFLATRLLTTVRDGISSNSARKLIRKSEGPEADLCLKLWQELMQIHTNTMRARAEITGRAMTTMEKRFYDAALVATNECLEGLQHLLPTPHFLASASSLLKEEDFNSQLRRRAIQLLADRVAEIEPFTPESSLFLEMVPELVEQVVLPHPDVPGDADSKAKEEYTISLRRVVVVQQAALMALERFARALCPIVEGEKVSKKATAVFLPALTRVASLLKDTVSGLIETSLKREGSAPALMDDIKGQLMSSTALCASSLVAIMKVSCLSLLPKLVKPLISALTSTNTWLGEGVDKDHQQYHSAELLQLSILRTLIAVAENLPQFLVPYLGLILSPSALPSHSLRVGMSEGELSVVAMAERLDLILASKTPARQLIPAGSKAIVECLGQTSKDDAWKEASAIFSVLKSSIEHSPRSEISPVIGRLLNSLILAYGYEKSDEGREELLSEANGTLLALVMKLSEAQLRPLYARLREWKGNFDTDKEEEALPARRYAFWSMSAALCKELKSIFLPCLSSVISDAVDELEFAASKLCSSSKKLMGGKKRQRLQEESFDAKLLGPLQPLLLCLELALKADAHDGGGWARGDDGQRYNMILSSLGKLLQARVPSNFPVHSDLDSSLTSFQAIVEGTGAAEHGSVVACLVALAAAAGNEQLWKPLNHAILTACENERAEVRKAGLSCLLTIIQTLGEEYMVLLPDCLPVLSELLEDSNEEIAGLAKECVQQGEELLGEDLEDSLR